MASHPRVAEWERLMMSLQQPAPGAGPGEWWTAMERVFEFHEPAAKA
jgi:L-rhamnose mutarotase